MFCPKCGSQNPDGAAFCGSCGEPFGANNQAATPVANSVLLAAQPMIASDGSVAAPAHNTGRKIGIVAAAVVVVVIAAILLFVFVLNHDDNRVVQGDASVVLEDTYVVQESMTFKSDGSIFSTTSYTLTDDGVTASTTTTDSDSSSKTYEYQQLGDGVTIIEGNTGRYETDANGYVTLVELNSDTIRTTYTYTYYRPGIIKSVTSTARHSDMTGTTITTYDEDGWPISREGTQNYSGETETVKYRIEHKLSSDEKTATITSINESDSSDTKANELRFDDHGNVIEIYRIIDGEKTKTYSYTYKKIDKPAKFIAATARLKKTPL